MTVGAAGTSCSSPTPTCATFQDFARSGCSGRLGASRAGAAASTVPTEPDQSKRVALYGQLNDIFLDQAFAVGLVGRTQDHLLSSKVHGVAYAMHESTDLTGVWLA